jgi:hypothetical protein
MSTIKEKIIAAIKSKGATRECNRCGKNKFVVMDEFARIDIQKSVATFNIGGPSIPCAVVICENCGNTFFHALGSLDLIKEIESESKPEVEGGSHE